MKTEHQCPRRDEVPATFRPDCDDTWRDDGSCSFCGSLNPDEFMRRLEAGDVRLVPTDKSYKVYVDNEGGESFKQSYRECSPGCNVGPDKCPHWTTRTVSETKFYFRHLSKEQKQEFINLVNVGKVKLAFPGRFYVTPYFMGREDT